MTNDDHGNDNGMIIAIMITIFAKNVIMTNISFVRNKRTKKKTRKVKEK